MTTETRDTIRVGDATIEYIAQGVGEPIVMIPTAGLEANSFVSVGRRLAENGFRTVAMNLRGTGSSSKPPVDMTLHTLAADVAAVIEGVARGRAHVLGYGFSNRIARCLLADRPDLVRSVVLVAGVGSFQPTPEVIRALQTWFRADAAESELLRDVMPYEVADPSLRPRILKSLTRFPDTAAACRLADRATPVDDWRRRSDASFLVVQGLEDRISPPSDHSTLRDELGANVDVADIPGAGHMVFLEQPDAVADAVIAFLRRD